MLLRQLEYLSALARERHFARAADACHVSQPSLSAGIRKLERDLGVSLVLRGQRYAGLTAEGERVLGWAHRILAECEALREDLSSMAGSLSGVLRVGAIPTALAVTPLITTPFCERHPHARVSLESLSSREISRRLGEFELDAALTYVDDGEVGDVRITPLYEERYLLLTPKDGRFADRGTVRWAEAAALPLCLLTQDMRNRRILDGFFAGAGATVVPAIETDTVAALYAHVATRRWSSVVSHAWLNMFGVPEGMRLVRLEAPPRFPRIGLIVADRHPEPLLAGALLDVVRRTDVRGDLERLLQRHLAPDA
ncbi:LysR family transcriptional regulator [Nocardiopsis ganjiahuensis]|uniref:LysR family transcriptional regulator n=1 Tax=Nocardiopsis ganjiahuensis TaxID=239984 RepID=UPI000476EE94|nr:LysR family transcriptional regulator [Nocardiopsis ganjiahuensis]